jgi:hypothetical protein
MWSKVKASPRKASDRTFDTVVEAVRDAVLAITSDDCEGYFEHCGLQRYVNMKSALIEGITTSISSFGIWEGARLLN